MTIAVEDARPIVLRLDRAPRRVVSLVPSVTETLFALGAADRLVGRSSFCVKPAAEVEPIRVCGGTKTPNLRRVRDLEPDLVLMNIEENTLEHIAAVEKFAPVFAALPRTIEEALADIEKLGAIFEREAQARAIVQEAADGLERLRHAARPHRFAYLIWRDPWMAAAGDTFISRFAEAGGGANVFADAEERYPTITLRDLVARDPDVVYLPDEPFEFAAKDAEELISSGVVPASWRRRLRLVEGDMFCWHGSRMRESFRYYRELLSP
jgi:ABC-type Fe3+-hydroxamate transport system substrate-binding protein